MVTLLYVRDMPASHLWKKPIEAAPYIYIHERYLNAILPFKNYVQEPATGGAGNREEKPPFPTRLPPICPQ